MPHKRQFNGNQKFVNFIPFNGTSLNQGKDLTENFFNYGHNTGTTQYRNPFQAIYSPYAPIPPMNTMQPPPQQEPVPRNGPAVAPRML